MRYLSVCSGIEAATVAWHPLGWTPVGFCEIEAFPSAVLAHHYPHVQNYGDFTRLIDAAHPVHASGVELLVGGTPCQAFSIAGLRRGLADARGGLTLEFVRLAEALRPRWIVWENVPGVLSQDGGRAFGAFLGALVELGYGFAYRVLDAQYFGVAQRRRRVFVVACAGGRADRAAAVLFEPEGVCRDSPPSRATREGAAAAAGAGAQGGSGGLGAGHDGGREGVVAFNMLAGNRRDGTQDKAYISEASFSLPLDCSGQNPDRWQGGTGVAHVVAPPQTEYPEVAEVCGTISDGAHNGGGLNGQDAYTGRILPVAFDTTQITSALNRSAPKPGDPCHPLAAGAHPPAVAFDARQTDVCGYGERTGPLDTDGHTIGVCKHMVVRRLTPVECERLQGFPDGHTAIPYRGKSAADGPRYKALGNSMAVPVMRWIGERIAKVENL